ncbi:TPA: hypothetical protein CPT85_02135 [Candidatus Gastranaerophilales bacterium HUM_21]|jgi:hypothetical protein|nr:MAG TPA: hypothetical protein CPT85_02135 [Candidatus Gastranaerophilales bacterium HUM_21]
MDKFIFEDYLLQAIILLGFFVFLSPFAILELVQKRNKKIDLFTQCKLKKIGIVAYQNFAAQDPFTAKEKTAQFMREVYKNGNLNQKYDLIRRA